MKVNEREDEHETKKHSFNYLNSAVGILLAYSLIRVRLTVNFIMKKQQQQQQIATRMEQTIANYFNLFFSSRNS